MINIEYLRRFQADIEIIGAARMESEFGTRVPRWWHDCAAKDQTLRANFIMSLWDQFGNELPSTLNTLMDQLQDCVPVVFLGRCHLLYVLKRELGISYYVGGNPIGANPSQRVSDSWAKISERLKKFYQFHNGWVNFVSRSLGLANKEDIYFLDQLEWGILDEIGDPECDLANLMSFFENGMGSCVAVSIKPADSGDVLWFKDKRPKLNVDFWGVVDAWIEIGINS